MFPRAGVFGIGDYRLVMTFGYQASLQLGGLLAKTFGVRAGGLIIEGRCLRCFALLCETAFHEGKSRKDDAQLCNGLH